MNLANLQQSNRDVSPITQNIHTDLVPARAFEFDLVDQISEVAQLVQFEEVMDISNAQHQFETPVPGLSFGRTALRGIENSIDLISEFDFSVSVETLNEDRRNVQAVPPPQSPPIDRPITPAPRNPPEPPSETPGVGGQTIGRYGETGSGVFSTMPDTYGTEGLDDRFGWQSPNGFYDFDSSHTPVFGTNPGSALDSLNPGTGSISVNPISPPSINTGTTGGFGNIGQ